MRSQLQSQKMARKSLGMELSKPDTAYIYLCLLKFHNLSVYNFIDSHLEHVIGDCFELNCKEAVFIDRFKI